MKQDSNLVAFPLTFYLKREGERWSALSPEVTVASCGETLDDARQGLQDAIETYVLYMLSEGRLSAIARPMEQKDLGDFISDPVGECVIEEHVLLAALGVEEPNRPELSFVPSQLPAHAAQRAAL